MSDENGTTYTAEQIAELRAAAGVPQTGQPLRSWIRYKLQQVRNPKTGRMWTQAAIALETHASEPHVSRVFSGAIESGHLSGRVRRLTAEILGIPEPVLFSSATEPGDTNGKGA